MRTVFCHKLQLELPALERAPYPGTLGQRIFSQVSQQAWREWLAHQTTLINEKRLNVLDPTARKFLESEMDNYFFGAGSQKPAGFVAPKES